MAAHRWQLESGGEAATLIISMWPLYNSRRLPEAYPGLIDETRARIPLSSAMAAELHLLRAWTHVYGRALDGAAREASAGLAKAIDTNRTHGLLLEVAARTAMIRGDLDQAEGHAKHAVAGLRKHGWSEEGARLLNTLGTIQQERSHYEEAVRTYQEAQQMALSHGQTLVETTVLQNLANCLSMMGDQTRALALVEQAREQALVFDDRATLHAVDGTRAATYARMGNYAEADEIFQTLLLDDERLGGRVAPWATQVNAGITALLAGHPFRARDTLDRVVKGCVEQGVAGNVVTIAKRNLSICCALVDDVDEALRHASETASEPPLDAHQLCMAHIDAAKAQRALKRGDRDAAMRLAERASAVLRQVDQQAPNAGLAIALLVDSLGRLPSAQTP